MIAVAQRRAAIPLTDGVYTIAQCLEAEVRRILSIPRRDDFAARIAKVIIFVLRQHGSPRTMRQRPTFNLMLRSTAPLIGLTKDQFEAALRAITSMPGDDRIIERVATAEDDHPRRKWSDGIWRCKPIVFRLSRQVALAMSAIHDKSEFRRAKSSTYTKFRLSFFKERASLQNSYFTKENRRNTS